MCNIFLFQLVAKQGSLKAFFREVQERPWTTSGSIYPQCQTGSIVPILRAYLKFSRDVEGYVAITNAVSQRLMPEGTIQDWVNSFTLDKQRQISCYDTFGYNCKELYINTVVESVENDMRVLQGLTQFGRTLEPVSQAMLAVIKEGEQKCLELKDNFVAKAQVAQDTNLEDSWHAVFSQGRVVMQSATKTLEQASRLWHKMDRENRQFTDLAGLQYNVTQLHNDIKRELELTRRLTYYREDTVDATPWLDADLHALRQSISSVTFTLRELEVKNAELKAEQDNAPRAIMIFDNWKVHENEYGLLLKMAKGNTDRAALLKEREEHEDSVEWKRICRSSDEHIIRQQDEALIALKVQEEVRRQQEIEEIVRREQEARDLKIRADLAERARHINQEHEERLRMRLQKEDREAREKELKRLRQEEEERNRLTHPETVAQPDGLRADLTGSTN